MATGPSYSNFLWLAGPVIAAAGSLVVAVILLGPAAQRGPIGWWLVSEALSFRHVLPLVGLGAAIALLPWRAGLIGCGAFAIGIVFGGQFIDALIAAAVQIPGATEYRTLTRLVSPVAFLAAGIALVSPARVRPYSAPLGALVAGVAFASFVRLTWPMFNDPGIITAGIVLGLWVMSTSALCVSAFRQPWFAIAGPIVGSWLICIALLDGGAVLLR